MLKSWGHYNKVYDYAMEIVAIVVFVGIFGILRNWLSRYANAGWAGLRQSYKNGSYGFKGKKLLFRRTILRNLAVSKDTWANDPVDRSILILGETELTRIISANENGLFLQEPRYFFSSIFIPWADIRSAPSKGGWPGWVQFTFLKASNMILFVPEDVATTLLLLSKGNFSKNW